MKFSTIITIIASVAVGSANASVTNTSFLRSTIKEDPAAEPESSPDCYKSCATVEGAKDFKKDKVTDSAKACADAAHCASTDRTVSVEQKECVDQCYDDFGKDVERAVDRAIDDCENKCEKSCSSGDEDESSGDCKKDCERECDSGSLDNSVARKADNGIEKSFATAGYCIDVCFATPLADEDYETLKIA